MENLSRETLDEMFKLTKTNGKRMEFRINPLLIIIVILMDIFGVVLIINMDEPLNNWLGGSCIVFGMLLIGIVVMKAAMNQNQRPFALETRVVDILRSTNKNGETDYNIKNEVKYAYELSANGRGRGIKRFERTTRKNLLANRNVLAYLQTPHDKVILICTPNGSIVGVWAEGTVYG